VNERKPGKETLRVVLADGPPTSPAGFGDPTAAGGDALALCIYDGSGERVARLEVDRAGASCGNRACWRPLGEPARAFRYKDATGSAAGVRRIALEGGGAGRPGVALYASNRASKGQTALPTGIAPALAETGSVTLQLHTSDEACLSALLDDVIRREADRLEVRRAR
jgi:hypothetical protein